MIELNYRDARPIYLQVKEGLRHLVVTGAIREGEQFPSVRALAAALAINPNTIQRPRAISGPRRAVVPLPPGAGRAPPPGGQSCTGSWTRRWPSCSSWA